MPRGTDEMDQMFQGGVGSGEFINNVWLRDNLEAAEGRFLTEHGAIYSEWCHRYAETSPKGKAYRVTATCPGTQGQACLRCANEDKRTPVFFMWFYTHFIDWASPGDNRETVTVGAQFVRYREHVNKPRLFQYATAHFEALREALILNGSLTDRVYRWTRRGEVGTTRPSYSLAGIGEPRPLSPELEALLPLLPDLADVAARRVRKIQLEDVPAPEVVSVAGMDAPSGEPVAGPHETPAAGDGLDLDI